MYSSSGSQHLKSFVGLRIFLFSVALLCNNLLNAGWVFTGRYIDQEGRTILQRLFIQDQKVKFEQYDIIYTFDLNTGRIVLVDPVRMIYHHSTIDQYLQNLKLEKHERLDILLTQIPESERTKARQSYLAVIDQSATLQDSVSGLPVNDTLKALGRPTEKYQVIAGRLKVEELWVIPDIDLSGEFSWEKYYHYLSIVEPAGTLPSYWMHNNYLNLISQGFPVRRIVIRSGVKSEYQFNKVEEKVIPDYEFYTPALCKEVTFKQWIERQSDQQPDYDDYE